MPTLGIKKRYPRLKHYFGKLTGYIQLIRPFTLLGPLLAGLFGVLTPVQNVTLHHLITAIYVGLTLALAQACGQCLNQYADANLDAVIKRYRPIPSGLIRREEALGVAWLLAIFAVGRGFTISVSFGLVVLILIFFAVFYSLTPLSPRKVNPILNTGWMAFSRGFLPMMAVWMIYGEIGKGWIYSVLAFLWVMGFQATKDVTDWEGDRAFEIQTIPNHYGLKGLVATMGLCSVLYTIFAIIFSAYPMLLVLPLAVFAVLTIKRKMELIENTIAWGIMYIGLSMIYALMFVSEHLGL